MTEKELIAKCCKNGDCSGCPVFLKAVETLSDDEDFDCDYDINTNMEAE